jgi:hypothetical protein
MSETPEVAAPAAPAPAPAAPVESAPVASVEPAAPAAAETSPAVTNETFKWDGWEGDTSGLPEDVQPWADSISSHHTKRYDELEGNHKNLKELYDALLTGGEDPRIKQFEGEKSAWDEERNTFQTKQTELQTNWDNTKRDLATYEQAVYQYHVQQAEKQLEDFVNARPEILKDEAKYELFSSLLDEKWDLESAGKLLNMSPEALEVARKAKSEGVPAAYAIKFAEKAPPQVQKPQPRPAATITSGAVSRTTPHASSRGMGDAKSLDESRAMASARALKLHKR